MTSRASAVSVLICIVSIQIPGSPVTLDSCYDRTLPLPAKLNCSPYAALKIPNNDNPYRALAEREPGVSTLTPLSMQKCVDHSTKLVPDLSERRGIMTQ